MCPPCTEVSAPKRKNIMEDWTRSPTDSSNATAIGHQPCLPLTFDRVGICSHFICAVNWQSTRMPALTVPKHWKARHNNATRANRRTHANLSVTFADLTLCLAWMHLPGLGQLDSGHVRRHATQYVYQCIYYVDLCVIYLILSTSSYPLGSPG